jgi:hypothetical protein
MNTLDAELRRFSARRMMQGMLAVGAALIAIISWLSTVTGHTQFDYHESLENALEGVGIALVFVASILGATFVGADMQAGSLVSQLLFEPRRIRLHLTKAVAVAIGTAVVTLGMLVVLAATLYVGAAVRGSTSGLDAGWWAARAGDALRVAVVSASAAAMSFAVTVVFRRTSAGLLFFFVQFLLFFSIDPFSHPYGPVVRFEPLTALLAVMVPPAHAGTALGIQTTPAAVVATAIWLVLLIGGSVAVFARAEVR